MENVYQIEQLLLEAGLDGFVPNKELMMAADRAAVRAPIDYLIDTNHTVPMSWKSKFVDAHRVKLRNAFDTNSLPVVEELQPDLEDARLECGFTLLALREL